MSGKANWNVLIYPGGTEVGMEINRALSPCKEVKVFSASDASKNHANFLYENNHVIPAIYEDNWLESFNDLLEELSIDYIYPAHPKVLDCLMSNREELFCDVLAMDKDIIEIMRSKKSTIQALEGKVVTPKVFSDISSVTNFPIFVKPDNMYGAQGAEIINSTSELKSWSKRLDVSKFILQEVLPGEEYSVDCFSNSKGELLFVNGRSRERIRMGTSMHSENAPQKYQAKITEIAQKINDCFRPNGAWFFQVKENSKGELALLEVEPRVAGTMCFSRAMGVNMPLLTLFDHEGYDVKITPYLHDVVVDRCLHNRFEVKDLSYDTVYIDLDDTIIVKGKVNTDAVKFLYQSFNDNKKIILISKSLEKDKVAFLEKYRIAQLFDETIFIEEGESKADYMTDRNSIFIDDSFSQCIEITAKTGIKSFHVSTLEVLIK